MPNHDTKTMIRLALPLAVAAALAGCSTINPPVNKATQERIGAELKAAAAPAPVVPAVPSAVSESLLPPVRSGLPKTSKKQLEPRFDLSVKDSPVDQVLAGIVADTRYSLLLRPRTAVAGPSGNAAVTDPNADRVTMDLRDVTVTEALDAMRDVYGYDYTIEGRRIYVTPPELQTRLYQVNYVIGQRRGVSDLKVIGGASVGASSSSNSSTSSSSSSTSGSGSGTSTNYSSVQASGLSTFVKADLWGDIEDVIRTTLGCLIPRNEAATQTTTASSSSSSSSGSSAAGSSRADVSFTGDAPQGQRQRGVDGCSNGRAMSLSQMSGTLLIRGMPNEHRAIEKLLKSMQVNLERQVIIEAKIIDVELNAGAQQGINWSNFAHGYHRASVGVAPNQISIPAPGAGTEGRGTLTGPLGTALGTALIGSTASTAFAAGLGMAVQFRNFSAMINFLESQGKVHVLSSPRISTLNNQKAVIKVGTEEPFVSSISPAQSATSGAATIAIASANLNYAPFFSGIALDVTPQIDDRGAITLHVHAMVNTVEERSKIAAPTADSVSVPFAVNSINETDNVVRAEDGQVIVIGGLMKETTSDGRSKVPGLGSALGPLFGKGEQSSSKRELVILLKPTIVKDSSDWAKDINAVQARLAESND